MPFRFQFGPGSRLRHLEEASVSATPALVAARPRLRRGRPDDLQDLLSQASVQQPMASATTEASRVIDAAAGGRRPDAEAALRLVEAPLEALLALRSR
jgi:hypothetical protein